MHAADFLAAWTRWTRLAQGAPALEPELLRGWAFAGHGELVEVLTAQLRRWPARPSAARVAADDDPRPVGAEVPCWRHLVEWLPPGPDAPADAGLVWSRRALAAFGHDVRTALREPWQVWPVRPGDSAHRAGWLALRGQEHGDWAARARWWQEAVGPRVIEVVRVVGARRGMPSAAVGRVVEEIEESGPLFLQLGDEVRRADELVVRLLETAPPTPVQALARLLDPEGWDDLCACLCTRGTWPGTVGAVVGVGSPARLASWLEASPERLEALVDLHLALRLVHTWRTAAGCAPGRAWRVVERNHQVLRGRLRMLAVRRGPPPGLPELDGLESRTRRVVGAWAWAWTLEVFSRDVDPQRPASPPCRPPELLDTTLTEDERAQLETWVALVVLRGRLSHLKAWLAGTTLPRDRAWERLLYEQLPPALGDEGPGRNGSYRRLREALALGAGPWLERWGPVLREVGRLEASRRLPAQVKQFLTEHWHPLVPFPRSDFPVIVLEARRWSDGEPDVHPDR